MAGSKEGTEEVFNPIRGGSVSDHTAALKKEGLRYSTKRLGDESRVDQVRKGEERNDLLDQFKREVIDYGHGY